VASSAIITQRFEKQVEITIAMVLSNVKDERASTLSLEFNHTFELGHENDCARILQIQHFCLLHNIS
jgi:flagellar motor switch protein FliG